MLYRDAVGGYPEGPGSEETHRPAPKRNAGRAGDASGSSAILHPQTGLLRRLLAPRRFRLQAAGLTAIALITALVLLLPARKLHIIADGDVTTINSHASQDEAAVEQAGIDLHPGDRVEDAGGGQLVVRRAPRLSVHVDGQVLAMRSQAETVGELLGQAGVALGPEDSVLRDGASVPPEASIAAAPLAVLLQGGDNRPSASSGGQPIELEVRRAVPFTIAENGQELGLRSSRQTVAAALRDVGVRLGPGDEVQPVPSTELTAGMEVRVDHAAQVVVTLPEGKAVMYTRAASVGEAIANSGIALPADYRLEPAGGTPIAAGLAVHVVAISSELRLETERIQSYTVYKPDPDLPVGTQKVVQGQDGVHYRQYTLVYQDDQLTSQELAAEWDDPKPVDTVVYYSTARPAPPQPAAGAAASAQGNWHDLVCSYDWDCSWALAVIACESSGNPNAYNPQGPYVGLFQIWEGHGANLRDPATNVAAAYSLYVSGGRGNWPNCP